MQHGDEECGDSTTDRQHTADTRQRPWRLRIIWTDGRNSKEASKPGREWQVSFEESRDLDVEGLLGLAESPGHSSF